jgi:hypothetical protein
MSKKRRKIDKDSSQMTIFDFLQDATRAPKDNYGQFKCVDRLRAAIRAAIKSCPLSRHQIAGEMSHLLGETISKESLDSWTRKSDERNGRPGRHIPAEYLPAFCRATGDTTPLEIMGQMIGLFVLPGQDALRSEIHKLDEMIAGAKASKLKRLKLLEEMEALR